MRVFVTGASGHIASAVIPELLANGHQVVGLARSDASAEARRRARRRGAPRRSRRPRRSEAAAAEADGVIHLAFKTTMLRRLPGRGLAPTWRRPRRSARPSTDRQAVCDRRGHASASRPGGLGDRGRPSDRGRARARDAQSTIALAARGVRPFVVRLPPTVHGEGDHGFTPRYRLRA